MSLPAALQCALSCSSPTCLLSFCKFCGLKCNISGVSGKCFNEDFTKTLHSVDGFMAFKMHCLQTGSINIRFLNTKQNQFFYVRYISFRCSKCFWIKNLRFIKMNLLSYGTQLMRLFNSNVSGRKKDLYWN